MDKSVYVGRVIFEPTSTNSRGFKLLQPALRLTFEDTKGYQITNIVYDIQDFIDDLKAARDKWGLA